MLGVPGALHERTRTALDGVRRRGEKAIVLLNRRGWSNFLSCRICGRVWECPDCDVTLVLHRAADEMACHHCGHREPVPPACSDCGSASVARHGAGTEQLERELEELVRPLPVFRLDADVTAAGDSAAVLRRVRCRARRRAGGHPDGGQGPRLPGGHARPWCSTPTPRCASPTFAPRSAPSRWWRSSPAAAGRGERGGEVIVQALDPAAPRAAARGRARRGRLRGGRARAPRGVRLPAVRAPGAVGLLVGRAQGLSWPRPTRSASAWRPPGCRCSGRRRCSGAAAATAPSWSCARASACRRSTPCELRWTRWPRSGSTTEWPSRWTSIRSSQSMLRR